jgi:hypothetical protein
MGKREIMLHKAHLDTGPGGLLRIRTPITEEIDRTTKHFSRVNDQQDAEKLDFRRFRV